MPTVTCIASALNGSVSQIPCDSGVGALLISIPEDDPDQICSCCVVSHHEQWCSGLDKNPLKHRLSI